MNNIMTPEHELWKEFVDRLTGPEGCNVAPTKTGHQTWCCSRNKDKPLATAILKTMPGIDVEKSLAYFEEHDGYCDCEILLNVDTTTWFSQMILGACKK